MILENKPGRVMRTSANGGVGVGVTVGVVVGVLVLVAVGITGVFVGRSLNAMAVSVASGSMGASRVASNGVSSAASGVMVSAAPATSGAAVDVSANDGVSLMSGTTVGVAVMVGGVVGVCDAVEVGLGRLVAVWVAGAAVGALVGAAG